MNNLKKVNTVKKKSKVLDKINSIKNKLSFKYIYDNCEVWDIVKTKDKDYFIKDKKNNLLVCESFIKSDQIVVNNDYYQNNVEEVIWINKVDKLINKSVIKQNIWILPMKWESIKFSAFKNIFNWKFISVLPERWDKTSILVDIWNNNFIVNDDDILEINDILVANHKNFYHNFWIIFEKWLSINVISKDWSSFTNDFIGTTENLKLESDWSTLITIKDQEDNSFDISFDEVEKIEDTDYTTLDIDYTLNFKDGDYENFSDKKDLTDYIENRLDGNLSSVENINQVPIIDDFYLEWRLIDLTDELKSEYFYPSNINIEDVNIWNISDIKKYKITNYSEAKSITTFKWNLSLENDIEYIEKLYKENSFYVYDDMIHIYYIIDETNDEIVITETNNDWEIYYELDDIDECFWLSEKSLKKIVMNDLYNKSNKNKLINIIWEKYWLEADYQMDWLRKIFNWYTVKLIED